MVYLLAYGIPDTGGTGSTYVGDAANGGSYTARSGDGDLALPNRWSLVC